MDVHKYENIIHVTLSLNPFPRERDLPSLSSNFSYFISLIIVALPGSFFMDVRMGIEPADKDNDFLLARNACTRMEI